MAQIEVSRIMDAVPQLLSIPFKRIWYSYDEDADVLYLNFKRPSHADDSELSDDDVIIRYEKGHMVGITVLHASKRKVTLAEQETKRRLQPGLGGVGAGVGRVVVEHGPVARAVEGRRKAAKEQDKAS